MKLNTLKAYAKHCETYVNRLDKNGRQYTYYRSQLDKTLEDIRFIETGKYKPSPPRDYVTGEFKAVSAKSPRKIAEKYFDEYIAKRVSLKEIAEQEGVVVSSLGKAFHRLKNLQPA